ncbi:MAG: TatD family hydrolase [Gammaproteobacteria bacterium]|nr:MAG: TatD family hydrolase [Gammaproteobacteria bacterium]
MTGLIDIGANLTHDAFDHDRGEVLARAAAAGVPRMIITGSTAGCSRQALSLARSSPGRLFATAGVHPHHAVEFGPDTATELVEIATHPEVVAVGECGLDYFRDLSPRAAQQHAFARQLGLAAAIGKPVFLHQRDAHGDFLAILREHIDDLPGGVAHCFTGTREQMEAYLDLGLYIGITGWICDDSRGESLRHTVAALPMDRVMIETDAPYLLPRSLAKGSRNRRNEPANLPVVLAAAARCMGVDPESLAAATTRNTECLFRLPPLSGGLSVMS